MLHDSSMDAKTELEARMGEMASLLAEVAEALTYYPDELVILDGDQPSNRAREGVVIHARDWPSIQEIEQLIANWRALTRGVGAGGPCRRRDPAD